MTTATLDLDRSCKPAPPSWSRPDFRVIALAAALLLGGGIAIGQGVTWQKAALYALGAALGLVLYHAAFGFASSWRRFVVEGRGAGLRAQMVMLALATTIFLPILAEGTLFGRAVSGAVAPFGVSVAVGAFLFGIGMQLAGACASGTLYTLGGGSTKMIITLAFFMVGAVIGTAHMPWWLAQPSLGTLSLPVQFGTAGALAMQLGVFALLAGLTIVIERRRHGRCETLWNGGPRDRSLWQRFFFGPWPLVWAAVLLALLNFATLAVAGHPWSVAFGYTLWGAKLASAAGLDIANWEFWTWRFPSQALQGSVFADTTSVMNFGILVGALLAAGLAGRFAPSRQLEWRPALAAVFGGLLMGYGARLAFGCNIGAYFSGVASGSLHGWLWFVAALVGTYLGNGLRPLFGLAEQNRR